MLITPTKLKKEINTEAYNILIGYSVRLYHSTQEGRYFHDYFNAAESAINTRIIEIKNETIETGFNIPCFLVHFEGIGFIKFFKNQLDSLVKCAESEFFDEMQQEQLIYNQLEEILN